MVAGLFVVGVSPLASSPAKADTTAQLEAEKAALLAELAALTPGLDSAQAALTEAEEQYTEQSAALNQTQTTLDSLNTQLTALNGEILDDQFQEESAQQALTSLTRATYESVTGNTVMTAVLSAKDFSSAMSSLSGASQVTTQIKGLEKTLDQDKSNLESAQQQIQADLSQAASVENQISDQANALEAVVEARDQALSQLEGPALQIADQIAAIDAELDPEPTLGGSSCADHFVFGECTYYVALRRCIPWSGNAGDWYAAAGSAPYDYQEGPTPVVGAVAVWGAYQGGAYGDGHVGYVEAVGLQPVVDTNGTPVINLPAGAVLVPSGYYEVSEMNWYESPGGYHKVDYRIVSDSGAMLGFIYGPPS